MKSVIIVLIKCKLKFAFWLLKKEFKKETFKKKVDKDFFVNETLRKKSPREREQNWCKFHIYYQKDFINKWKSIKFG